MQREHVHTRTIDFDAGVAADGHTTVDAKLCDLRRLRFMSSVGNRVMRPGVVHDVELELVADASAVVEQSRFRMLTVPFSDPDYAEGQVCREIEPAFVDLAGVAVDDDYVRTVNARIGGPRGCFHGLALAIGAGPVMGAARERHRVSGAPLRLGRYILIDGFRHGEAGITLTGRLQDTESPEDGGPATSALGDVVREVEVSVSFDVTDFRYRDAEVAVRAGGGRETPGADALNGLVMGPGIFKEARKRLGDGPIGRSAMELLSMMIPVTTQAAMAQMRRAGTALKGADGNIAQIDSCHMWAAGGPLVSRVQGVLRQAAGSEEDGSTEPSS